ncbi:MAG TPA: hypothetical protein DCZ01_06015 [Elusimicrobia bacterium]|nr:MAG: hypothetical protein A2X37_06360 [Elusimicrobia bacterium GWA2_66_18]HAZ08071.1 hypothetical protein [Elusimicrobiota bacterium]
MKIGTLLVVAFLCPAARAAGPSCAGGRPPRMTGDLFVPIECSTAAAVAASLPVEPSVAQKPDLKALSGTWEGSAVQGFGRYQILATLEVGWLGRAHGTLALKELQFREHLGHRLKLTPAKGKGRYGAALSTDSLPAAALKGEALFTTAPDAAASGRHMFEVVFANGASHRARWAFEGEDALRVTVWSSVPGAPPRSWETVLRRSTRQR